MVAMAGAVFVGFGVLWSATADGSTETPIATASLERSWNNANERLRHLRTERPDAMAASPAAQHAAYAAQLYELWSAEGQPASLEDFEDTVALLEVSTAVV